MKNISENTFIRHFNVLTFKDNNIIDKLFYLFNLELNHAFHQELHEGLLGHFQACCTISLFEELLYQETSAEQHNVGVSTRLTTI